MRSNQTIPDAVKSAVPIQRDARPTYTHEYLQRRSLRWPLVVTRMLIDVTLVNIAFILAYYARYELHLFRGVQPESDLPLSVVPTAPGVAQRGDALRLLTFTACMLNRAARPGSIRSAKSPAVP